MFTNPSPIASGKAQCDKWLTLSSYWLQRLFGSSELEVTFSWNCFLLSKPEIAAPPCFIFNTVWENTSSCSCTLCSFPFLCLSQVVTLIAHEMWPEQSDKLDWELGQARKELTAACLVFCCVWVESNCHFPDLRHYQSLGGADLLLPSAREVQGKRITRGVWNATHLTACNKLKKQKSEIT